MHKFSFFILKSCLAYERKVKKIEASTVYREYGKQVVELWLFQGMVKKKLLTRKGFGKTDLKVERMYVVRVSI